MQFSDDIECVFGNLRRKFPDRTRAKVGLEAFRMTTPGMGTGLGAGFASAKRAEDDSWAAENDFLRRPGYAWYFGRDSIWSAFAADAYGGSDLAEFYEVAFVEQALDRGARGVAPNRGWMNLVWTAFFASSWMLQVRRALSTGSP